MDSDATILRSKLRDLYRDLRNLRGVQALNFPEVRRNLATLMNEVLDLEHLLDSLISSEEE